MTFKSSLRDIEVLKRSRQYATLLDRLPAAFYVCDVDGYITFYNQAAATLWGRTPEIGRERWCGSWKTYDSDGTPMPPSESPMAATLRTKRPALGEETIIEQPQGRRFHVMPYPYPLFDRNGVLTGAVNMLVDISERVDFRRLQRHTNDLAEAMNALQKSEERYHRMTAEVQDYVIILLSGDGIIENWNIGAEKIKGYTEAEIVGRHFRIFYPPEDQANQVPEQLLAQAKEHGKANHEGWRIRKDGTRFWASTTITALHGSAGEIIGFSKVTRDLTELRRQDLTIRKINEDLRKRNELLRQSEERYYRMVAEIEDYVIILLDVEGIIQNWNKGAEKIKGYATDEIVGKHFSIFYPEEDRKAGTPQKLLCEASRNGKALHEGWRVRKDGSAFWGSVVMTALHNDGGAIIGFTKVTRDLTDKKIAEEKLMQAAVKLQQKNKELERINEELASFAYISSHDLQEPLRKIQTFSDRILEMEYNNLSEKGRDYFMRMLGGASRMQKLIRDILTYSRTTMYEKKLEATDLNHLLAHSASELEVMIAEKKATIESDTLPTIRVVPFQLQQLFNNLLSNALKFSKPDVPVHIVIRSETLAAEGLPEPTTTSAAEYCHLSFADNGIGFEPEFERKIFEVFQRLHNRNEFEGTGIGLAICKKIAENHGGFMTADGRPGLGATFHVYLPIVT